MKRCTARGCLNAAKYHVVFKVPLIIGGTNPAKKQSRLAPMILFGPEVCADHCSARTRDYASEDYWSQLVAKYREMNFVALWDEMSVEFHPLSSEAKLKDKMKATDFEQMAIGALIINGNRNA